MENIITDHVTEEMLKKVAGGEYRLFVFLPKEKPLVIITEKEYKELRRDAS